jgi:hypothetical protein
MILAMTMMTMLVDCEQGQDEVECHHQRKDRYLGEIENTLGILAKGSRNC